MFRDRMHAGKKLAEALSEYRNGNAIVLAIPRGGVEVGFEVARKLNAEFSIIVSRKLPFVDEPESGFGAIAEDGSIFMLDDTYNIYSKEVVGEIIREQKKETARRVDVLRGGKPLPEIKGRTVIIVDDGIAMGSTMKAAIMLCRKAKAKRIIAAAPVTSLMRLIELSHIADQAVAVETPDNFCAVASSYENWYDVNDYEVIDLMEAWEDLRREQF
ncbi:MAG TPA: phosphoribosyltransferase [Lentisphaeria bacterium]|nr:MAG: phosphoribosyltransferase [Lentisphaerae bacterium GWF2_50_93]HCE46996.1 phosphoribosyltransferase [Lentisphaeria bacterium]